MDSLEEDYSISDYGDYYNGSLVGLCIQKKNQSVSLVLGPYVHSVMCFLGLVGNGLMLLTLCCSTRPPSITQTLLLHLALADLVIVAALPGLVVMEGAWPDGGVACKLLRGGYSLSLYSAALLLAAVSADRYAAVVHARRRLGARSQGLSQLVSAIVWVTAATLSLPSFIFYDRYVPKHQEFPSNWVNLSPGQNLSHENDSVNNLDQDWTLQMWYFNFTNGSASDSAPLVSDSASSYVCELRFENSDMAQTMKVLIPTLQFTVGFLIPFLIMSFCYGSVLHTLLKGRSLCGERRGSGKGGQGFRRERAVRLVLMVALVFVLCHAPFNILLLWKTSMLFKEQDCQSWDGLEVALSLAQTWALLHCVLNPLLYGFNSAPFRTAFCGVLHKLRPQRRLSSTSQSERSTHYTL